MPTPLSRTSRPILYLAFRLSSRSSKLKRGCPHRTFQSSSRRDVINEALQASHAIFETVHTYTGLPWGVTLPLTAVCFRLLFLPVQYMIERNTQRRLSYQSVALAWLQEYRRQFIQKEQMDQKRYGPNVANQWTLEMQQKKEKQLKGRHGYQSWMGWLPWTFLPVWLINADVVRRLIGMDRSIFGLFTNVHPDKVPTESAMSHEGLLWFHDLAIADPTHALPIAFWALVGTNIYLMKLERPPMTRKEIGMLSAPVQRFRARAGLLIRETLDLFALLIGPILIWQEIPSGLVLYFFGSTATHMLEKRYLKKLLGDVKGVKPAKPLRPRAKRDFGEASDSSP